MSVFCSCSCTAWLVFSVYGACSPVNILGRRSLHLPGDPTAKVSVSLVCHVFAYTVTN